MKFDNLEHLIKYILEENINVKNTKFSFDMHDDADTSHSNVVESNLELHKNVKLSSLFESPEVLTEYSDTNILYVDSVESIPNSCSTGKIEMFGKIITTKICDMNEQISSSFPLQLDDGCIKGIEFVIKRDVGNNRVVLDKNIFD